MTMNWPPLRLGNHHATKRPIKRPFYFDNNCVLAYLGEINTKWRDQSGNSNHATKIAGTVVQRGRYGDAFYCDGSDSEFEASASSELNIAGAFTVMCWAMRLGNASDIGGLMVDKSQSGDTRNYALQWRNDGTIRFQLYDDDNNATRNVDITGYTQTGVWRHVCGVSDATNMNLYIDAVVGNPTAIVGTPSVHAVHFVVGRLGFNVPNNWVFNGLIDEVMVFDRELKPWEITAIYKRGKSP